MVRVEDLVAAIQGGQSADELAAEYAKALNEANARIKADAEAKAKADAEARAAAVKVANARAVVEPLVKYIQTDIPEMGIDEVTEEELNEAAKFLVVTIDELKTQLAPQLQLLKALGGLDLDDAKPSIKITRKPQTIGDGKDPIGDFLKEMGL